MGDAGHRTELVEIIRQIRNRWRLKLALRGIVVVVAGSLLALLLSASGLEAFRFSPNAIIPFRSAEASTPYRIEVTPGTATVPRGSDQQVKAKLIGFKSGDAEVRMRSGATGAFERVPLVPSADAAWFEGILFHVEKTIEYY